MTRSCLISWPARRPRSRSTWQEESILKDLNDRIGRGEVVNRGGKPVEKKIDGGLVREDGAFLYPIEDDIPIMLIDEAIPLKK